MSESASEFVEATLLESRGAFHHPATADFGSTPQGAAQLQPPQLRYDLIGTVNFYVKDVSANDPYKDCSF